MTFRHGRSRRRPALAAVGSAAALVLGLCLNGCTDHGSSAGDTFTVNGATDFATVAVAKRVPAPAISGPTVDGGTARLSDLRGSVVVINVWGAWCTVCRVEAADFVAVAAKYHDRGVRFLGIDTRDQSVTGPKAFEKHYGMPYPSIYDRYGKQILRFRGTLAPQAVPSTLIIDRQGRVAARALKPVNGDTLEQELDAVLAEGAAPHPAGASTGAPATTPTGTPTANPAATPPTGR